MIIRLDMLSLTLATVLAAASLVAAQCPLYQHYAYQKHAPYTEARWNLSYARPIPSCRTFVAPEVEDTIQRLKSVIVDPDLFRIFENSWPSTLDTTIGWRGLANRTDEVEEELTFVITGDIEAMWLRDSANQLQAYVSVLRANSSQESLAGLYRGAINLQARYILEAPFCNAFQAPPESGIMPKSSLNSDQISPSFNYMSVFSCQWELDSVASFLQMSNDYATATGDVEFFRKYNWTAAVETILKTAESMTVDSYTDTGRWQHTPYTYCAPYGGTPINVCNGSPHRGNIGLIRSFHRPSDDACTYQYLIPSNMMFSRMLNLSSTIMEKVEPEEGNGELTSWMRSMSSEIHEGIEKHAIVQDAKHGAVYAYEVDGYGSTNMMDDPNIPSLLSAPFLGYLPRTDRVYQNTRSKILSRDSPYYSWGPVISGVGSPHTQPGKAWPMANIMVILTSDDDEEIVRNLRDLIKSTDGFGLMHESVDSHIKGLWSRQW
jgi:meiotically up-regulated gene 157 (Mug157) protein